ncbi:hypothetical protein M0L63_RS18955, partial [Providencia rettgeri]|nr:hypothetical protein [Providencia rettgeri]
MREVKPTQKPVPSSDIKDLFFNSGLLDIWATSLEPKYIDRFGNCHLTAAGMEWLFKELVEKFKVDMNTAIVAAGYITIDSFQQGADLPNNELTQRNHILRDETTGEYYRWDGDLPKQVPAGSTPQSTGSIGKGAWISVGDASLRSDMPKIQGFVEGWRSQYADDTDCINAALSESTMVVKLENGRHYYVRGGVLYTRKYQTLDLNGAFVWLIDDAGIYRLTIFEMDDHSQIINGVIDGNYQNNIHDSANWVTNVDLIPFAQGIFTSRYLTNNNIPKKAIGARVDNVTVRNTIRSNFVLTGKDQLHGNITAQNSYADHLIYFTGSDNVKYEKAYIDGICRGEAISIGTAGSG